MESAERGIILQALIFPLGIAAGFRLVGVPRTQALLRWWGEHANSQPGAADPLLHIRRVRRAQRIVRRSTGIEGNCLVRSLTLWALLLRWGIPTDLRVGFRKRDGRIQGHAWVEFNHQPVNDAACEIRTFVPYDRPASFDLWRRVGPNASR